MPSPNYRIAILADIHGNVEALRAVLADIRRFSPDRLILAGDLVMNGPRPAETLACITPLDTPSVLGNTDAYVIEGADPVAAWTGSQIGPNGIAYLRSLPLSYRMTPPGGASPADDLLVVHSTPRSYEDILILTPQPSTTIFTQVTPLAEAEEMLQGPTVNLIVYGHIHYLSRGMIGGQRVVSIGSVGFPFDGDRRAAYALAEWDGVEWNVEPQRVVYGYEGVAGDLEGSGIPFPERYAKMIRRAAWFPRPDTV